VRDSYSSEVVEVPESDMIPGGEPCEDGEVSESEGTDLNSVEGVTSLENSFRLSARDMIGRQWGTRKYFQ